MKTLLTLLLISICSCAFGQLIYPDHVFPFPNEKFVKIKTSIRTFEMMINYHGFEVAFKENGKWVINDAEAALEVMLKSSEHMAKELDRVREESNHLREIINQQNPKSFSVKIDPTTKI